jgi:hypothetical protein
MRTKDCGTVHTLSGVDSSGPAQLIAWTADEPSEEEVSERNSQEDPKERDDEVTLVLDLPLVLPGYQALVDEAGETPQASAQEHANDS